MGEGARKKARVAVCQCARELLYSLYPLRLARANCKRSVSLCFALLSFVVAVVVVGSVVTYWLSISLLVSCKRF